MLLLRVIGILVAIAIAAGVIAWVLTGQRGYLMLALRLAKYALILILGVFALLAFERLIVL